ncbi:MAG TPA: hypothetical protein VMH04_21545 [Candidatus Solibacter sp.]|nr:hypothetical protein [Candidatus Solibacter sp.]
MVIVVPVATLGQTPGAILHTQGGVWVNGYEARDSSAIFSGDLLETKTGFSATFTLDGTSVLIQPESVAKFDGDVLVLDHGSVAVETSRSFKVRVNCITVVPVVNEFTQYEVTDVTPTVHVAARKLDVNVEHHAKQEKTDVAPQASQEGSVHQGEEKNYDESAMCGGPLRRTGAASMRDPKWIAAGAGGAGVLIWILIHGGGNKQPVSASQP